MGAVVDSLDESGPTGLFDLEHGVDELYVGVVLELVVSSPSFLVVVDISLLGFDLGGNHEHRKCHGNHCELLHIL